MSEFKRVYLFTDDPKPIQKQLKKQGRKLKELLGGKGANLVIMTSWGVPVPPGFTVTVDTCNEYVARGQQMPPGLEDEIFAALAEVEQQGGKRFGDPDNPLLVSVRSGAAESMPGMMDTVLNLGMNDAVVEGMRRLFGDDRFVFDAYRRLVMMFGDVVMGVERVNFEECLDQVKREEGVSLDVDVSSAGQRRVVELEKAVFQRETGREFPQDPREQLLLAVRAVFDSADNDRAIEYRRIHKIPQSMRTAVNVQTMVFGNMGSDCGTGVAFSRDPGTGENALYGEFLLNAQGEDVVAGLRTPQKIEEMAKAAAPELRQCYKQFVRIARTLERKYKNIQDMEFTIERGKLWMLQTRNGKRTAQAAVKIAVDLVDEGLVKPAEAVTLVAPDQLDQLLHKQFSAAAKKTAERIATGVNASPGAAVGQVVFTADDAAQAAREGRQVILVRVETSPDDVGGMKAAEGILTSRGGKTCHAAIVGRQMGKTCVVGCEALTIDYRTEQFRVDGRVFSKGDWLSIDGGDGAVMAGQVATTDSEILQVLRGQLQPDEAPLYKYFARFMAWADEVRAIGVRTNADTPPDCEVARLLGAEGIGLTRTEHMFFGEDRIRIFQQMILTEGLEAKIAAAARLLPFQREDFEGILRVMDGLPVIIRLLDPPLHEFLPRDPEGQAEVAQLLGKPVHDVEVAVEALHEANPMLGHRGCRLGITNPEIYKMQVRAIFEAACSLRRQGLNPKPEVMVPLVGSVRELEICRRDAEEVAQAVMAETGVKVDYMIGTMIEVPRAAVTADKIAKHADFFSFGTNDMTQMTYGFSRDDVEARFFELYMDKDHMIFEQSPFDVLDREGVGEMVRMGTERGRSAKPTLEVGICGEHGGEPKSVEFCHLVGMDYVSCSPLRVPVARLAAAQAQLDHPRKAAKKSE